MLSYMWMVALVSAGQVDAPLEVVESKPLPALTKQFLRPDGWTGGDGAHSFPLSKDRTLWLFADTWIGAIENGKRVRSRMINNTASWQSLQKPDEPMRFFWAKTEKGPDALLKPEQNGAWYWPGDGAMVEGKLYLFCKVVRRREKGEPGFQFDWFQNELLEIANPQEEPTRWQVKRYRLPNDVSQPRLGVACSLDDDHLYVFGLFPESQCKFFNTPLAVARISRKQMRQMDRTGWEFWCESANGSAWTSRPEKLVSLFRDAPAEFTVSRVRGIAGFIATYTQNGIGGTIMVRHANRLEGPWSKPLIVYKAPKEKNVFQYGAQAHPELSQRDGQLIITYCRNIGSLAEHVKHPEIYIPQGVEVHLRWTGK